MLYSKILKGILVVNIRRNSTKAFNLPQKIDAAGYALLAIPITTFALGTWQVKRRKWKLNLIDELTKKTITPSIDFPDDIDKLSQLEYRKVRVKGKFDHSKEVYIGPRSLINEKEESAGSIFSTTPHSGYHVITPFEFTDRDLTILVNRGWVPKNQLQPQKRSAGQINEEIDLTGIVRLTEKRPPFMSKNRPDSPLFHYRDIDAIAEKCGTSPIFLDATSESSVPNGPIGGQTRVTLRNEHLSYIITWYSLSAATLWIWYKKYIKGAYIK